MAVPPKAGKVPTVATYYGKEDTGKVVYEERQDCVDEINKYVELIDKLKVSDEVDDMVKKGLGEIKYKLESLRVSDMPSAEVKKRIRSYTRVPLSNGKFMHLSSFLTSTGSATVVSTEQEYLQQVGKMIKNTLSNLTNLLIANEQDEHLKAFLDDLNELKANTNYAEVKGKMEHLNKSGIIKYYNKVKLQFLQNWLKPFEKQLGKPIQKMDPKEIQEALSKVENLKKQELESIGMRLNNENADQFRPYNAAMHEIMNGKNSDFWGFPEYRDEFINLVKSIINRFSFKLENHYLVFENGEKTMAYLVGFPDDTFEQAKKIKGGKIGLTPHLKVFFKTDAEYKELTREDVDTTTQYYNTLRTSVVPFLVSISMIVETPLSDGIKDAFNMWV